VASLRPRAATASIITLKAWSPKLRLLTFLSKFNVEHRRRWVILLLGLVHGFIYLVIIPPWQHYDEPGHFEYVWLIAHSPTWPKAGTVNTALRRSIAASMLAHNFFYNQPARPDLTAPETPSIGQPQVGAAPLYYVVASLPLRLFHAYDPIESQLYLARGMSLLLFGLTLMLADLLICELTPAGHTLRWLIPVSMALLPSFVDIMTAVNDDVGAVLVFTLFLWATTQLIRRGPTWRSLLSIGASIALCLGTKTTVLVALPLGLVALGLALVPLRWNMARAASLLLGGFILLPLVFTWGDAAAWYRMTPQPAATRLILPKAPLGHAVLQLETTATVNKAEIRQPLLPKTLTALSGQTATLGAWIWATAPVHIGLPAIGSGYSFLSGVLTVTTAPTFYAFPVHIAPGTTLAQVILLYDWQIFGDPPATVYFSGIVLTEGERPLTEPPIFTNADGLSGIWGGQPFRNLLRNPSAQASWPRIRPWVETLVVRYADAYLSPTQLISGVLDWSYTGWLYLASLRRLVSTFWAVFGWGQVTLPLDYWVLWLVTALGLFGGLVRFAQIWPQSASDWRRRQALLWLGMSIAVIWFSAGVRVFFTLLNEGVHLPVARYTYPVLVPVLLVLVAGWRAGLPVPPWAQAFILGAAGLFLAGISILTLVKYYQGF